MIKIEIKIKICLRVFLVRNSKIRSNLPFALKTAIALVNAMFALLEKFDDNLVSICQLSHFMHLTFETMSMRLFFTLLFLCLHLMVDAKEISSVKLIIILRMIQLML